MLLETHALTKRYGDFTALDALEISIPSGEIFGLLGPNGAGKSTALRLILGFLKPTSGRSALPGTIPGAMGYWLGKKSPTCLVSCAFMKI